MDLYCNKEVKWTAIVRQEVRIYWQIEGGQSSQTGVTQVNVSTSMMVLCVKPCSVFVQRNGSDLFATFCTYCSH